MLGNEIKKYLLENGLKQSFLSEKTGISISKLNSILNNNRKILAEEYFLICKALNVDVCFFYNELQKG